MLGHLVYNHNHLDDARIQQEISKNLYAQKLDKTYVVHAYNGEPAFGYKKYLEDKLIKIKNREHFQGAADLINAGLKFFTEHKIPGLKYVLVTAADTWALNTQFLAKCLQEMKARGQVLAACSWGKAVYPEPPAGLSTDFFIIDIEWNRKAKLFPLNYENFKKKFADFFYVQYRQPTVEYALQYAFQNYFATTYLDNEVWRQRNKSLRRIQEREPIHTLKGNRRDNWPKIGLYTSPEPKEKKAILKKLKFNLGEYSHKLIHATNISYYNKTN